jgi:hypothetical protein
MASRECTSEQLQEALSHSTGQETGESKTDASLVVRCTDLNKVRDGSSTSAIARDVDLTM